MFLNMPYPHKGTLFGDLGGSVSRGGKGGNGGGVAGGNGLSS